MVGHSVCLQALHRVTDHCITSVVHRISSIVHLDEYYCIRRRWLSRKGILCFDDNESSEQWILCLAAGGSMKLGACVM